MANVCARQREQSQGVLSLQANDFEYKCCTCRLDTEQLAPGRLRPGKLTCKMGRVFKRYTHQLPQGFTCCWGAAVESFVEIPETTVGFVVQRFLLDSLAGAGVDANAVPESAAHGDCS